MVSEKVFRLRRHATSPPYPPEGFAALTAITNLTGPFGRCCASAAIYLIATSHDDDIGHVRLYCKILGTGNADLTSAVY